MELFLVGRGRAARGLSHGRTPPSRRYDDPSSRALRAPEFDVSSEFACEIRTSENALGDRLAGKVTIVTGAGSGIGRASAIRFAEEGARVTCVDIDRDAVEAVARELGDVAFAVGADVADAAQVKAYTD